MNIKENVTNYCSFKPPNMVVVILRHVINALLYGGAHMHTEMLTKLKRINDFFFQIYSIFLQYLYQSISLCVFIMCMSYNSQIILMNVKHISSNSLVVKRNNAFFLSSLSVNYLDRLYWKRTASTKINCWNSVSKYHFNELCTTWKRRHIF